MLEMLCTMATTSTPWRLVAIAEECGESVGGALETDCVLSVSMVTSSAHTLESLALRPVGLCCHGYLNHVL